MRWRLWLVITGVWLCAGCAGPAAKFPALAADDVAAEKRSQEIAQLKDYYAQLHRLDTVAFRIARANRADCKEWVSAQIGLYAATPQSLPRKFQSFSAEAFGLRWVGRRSFRWSKARPPRRPELRTATRSFPSTANRRR